MGQRSLKRQIRKLVLDRESLGDLHDAYNVIIQDLIDDDMPGLADKMRARTTLLMQRWQRITDEISRLRADVRGVWTPRWLF